MIISEVNAVLDLVIKATSLTTQLQDGWYKGSAEVEAFQHKVWVLSAKHGQWSEQLQRYGAFQDKHLLRLVKAAEEALEKQHQSVVKLQKSRFRRWKKRVFPVQLSYLLDKVLEIVEAGPQLLAARVANNNLLERYMAQIPAPLPFVEDGKYVPIVDSVWEVRNTLENAEAPRIVTIHGGPGMGKSSLVKYLAVHYQEEQKRLGIDAWFPHGVYYLFCGQHAGERIKQLQLELLENLGFGIGSATPFDSSTTSTGVKEGDYISLQSHKVKLRSLLAEQKLLIILDDLWEEKVLQELLVHAKGVKYLLTSQISDISNDAEKIQIKTPTPQQCSYILANYTKGLPQKGEFPTGIKGVTDDIIRKLEYHPLSLANIGMSINKRGATDINQWDVIRKHLYAHLDENESQSPDAYNLPLSASMMLMVESLPREATRLLLLMALFESQHLPQPLVKYFYGFMQPNHVRWKYGIHEKCLEDRSLVEVMVRGNRSTLGTHALRTHYIRERKDPEVRSVCSHILAASREGDIAGLRGNKRGDGEETLVTVLSAMFFDQSFKDAVARTFEKHINVINDGVIPRSLSTTAHTLDLVQSVKYQERKIHNLVWLLSSDLEEENWKRESHEHAKKVIIKFVCQGKLEDKSMKCLFKLPQTTLAACKALSSLCYSLHLEEQNIAFSEAYGATMEILLALFEDIAISTEIRTAVVLSLLDIHSFERKETIFNFSARFVSCAMKSDPKLRDAITHALSSTDYVSQRAFLTMTEPSGLLEFLIAILVSGNDQKLRLEVASIINQLAQHKQPAMKIVSFPNALNALLELFSSENMLVSSDRRQRIHGQGLEYMIAGEALFFLSLIPENRVSLGTIAGIWEGLGGILAKLEEVWLATHDRSHRRTLEKQACVAAGILGYLGLEEDLRETIRSLPGVREGLAFLQLIEMANTLVVEGNFSSRLRHMVLEEYISTRAWTVLYSEYHGYKRSTDLPSVGDLLEVMPRCCYKGLPSKEREAVWVCDRYSSVYWSRLLAYRRIGSYAEALNNLDLLEHHVDGILKDTKHENTYIFCIGGWEDVFCCNNSQFQGFRQCRMFLHAMLENYAQALVDANILVQESTYQHQWAPLAERGVLKRLSGDLQGALDDLNAATMEATMDMNPKYFNKDEVLWQRGYVKYLMDDKKGATEDAEAAQQLKLDHFVNDNTYYRQNRHSWQLTNIPVNYKLGI